MARVGPPLGVHSQPAYSTPDWLAQHLLAGLLVKERDHVLDPCAGTGGILREAQRCGASSEYYELSIRRHNELRAQGWSGKRGDMRLLSPSKPPTVVALNPDFRFDKWVPMVSSALRTAEQQGSRAFAAVVPRGWMQRVEEHLPDQEHIMRAALRCYIFREKQVVDWAFVNAGEPVLVTLLTMHLTGRG